MTDFTHNGSAYRDPKVFVPWISAVTEPGFHTQMGVSMMAPGNGYPMMNPQTYGAMGNMANLANPAAYPASTAANTAGTPAFNFFDPNAWMNRVPTAASTPSIAPSHHAPVPAASTPSLPK